MKGKETVLVTGASGGIGAELARIFARNGYNLVLVARQEEKLQMLARELQEQFNIEASIMIQDLIRPEAPEKIFSELAGRQLPVQVLINNAGFGEYGFFCEIDLQRQLDMMQVNMTSLVHLSRLFLDQLPETSGGKILNIASTAAFQPGPLMAVYYATKAFVLSFSGALANELQSRKVTVTALCPGPTSTGFEKEANLSGSSLFAGNIATAPEVAQAGYDGLLAGRSVVIPGARNKLLAFSTRLAPREFVTSLVRYMQEKK